MRAWFLLSLLAAAPFWAAEMTYDPSRFQSTRGGNIPFYPLDDPRVVAARKATYLDAEDIVLGIEVNGEARAYPVRFIAFHHVVNDVVGGRPVALTY
jgi:hypothetical protein